MSQNIAVITGVGGMGQAIARRIGPGAHLLLADLNEETLDTVAGQLRDEGYEVTSQTVDVASHESVGALAERAASLGEVRSVVHTARLPPFQADVPAILTVDLLGVALVLEEFGKVVAPGGAGVVIAGMATYHHPPVSGTDALELATIPADQLLSLPILAPGNFVMASYAYGFAKQVSLLRVQAASTIWGARGARVNAISPGVIGSPMSQAEPNGRHAAALKTMIDASNAGRSGTPAEIAAAAEFLLSPAAGFICGTDLLVDGGVVAALRSGRIGRPTV
ncbi:SDR family oxidoreductase [Streptomyces sp. NPDC006355]|uniref:SDR family oxidoreductase n=1 Tax=Streptomyces sp. NPDC006355 TaxID=3156758 RepID=UPI0033A923E8